jgi:hypothetical protein
MKVEYEGRVVRRPDHSAEEILSPGRSQAGSYGWSEAQPVETNSILAGFKPQRGGRMAYTLMSALGGKR